MADHSGRRTKVDSQLYLTLILESIEVNTQLDGPLAAMIPR